MKVNNPTGAPLSGVGKTGGGGKISSDSGQPSSGYGLMWADRVQLSNLSAHLAAARGDSNEHVAKLSALSTTLSQGNYRVDANVVSDSIIRHSLQFGGANYL